MYCNTSCTLYLKSLNYASFNCDCFLTHRKIASYSKEGLSYPEEAFIMATIAGKTFTEGQDFIVEGTCTATIDNTTEQTFSTSMKALKSSYKVYTVMCADYKEFGSSGMRHIEISCK